MHDKIESTHYYDFKLKKCRGGLTVMRKVNLLSLFIISLFFTNTSFAQNDYVMRGQFQDVLFTAGYSTAFGAALGAATLGITMKDPAKNFHYITFGASLGFISGTFLGSYLYLLPAIAGNGNYLGEKSQNKPPQLSIFPILTGESKITGVGANWMVASF